MKTKTKQKILKVLAICILFLSNIHLMAQTSQTVTQTVCASSPAEPYLINPPSVGSIYQWTLSGGGVINPVSTSNSITIDWGAIAGGPHTLEVIESNGGCYSTLVTLDITIVDGPTATAGPNSDVCVGDIYSLSSASATNQVSVLWTTSGDGTFTNASLLNPDYIPGTNDIATGTVDLILTATGSAPAGSACATNSSTLNLIIHPVPTASAGTNDNVCAGNNYTLSGSSTNGTGAWTTSGTGTFTNVSSANSDYTPSLGDITAGTVLLEWSVSGSAPSTLACNSATSSMTLTIIPGPTAFAGPADNICDNIPYSLSSAAATNQVSVLWTAPLGDGIFTNTSSLNPDYTPGPVDIASGTVDLTLTVTGNSPCLPISSTMTLTVIPNPTPGPIFHN